MSIHKFASEVARRPLLLTFAVSILIGIYTRWSEIQSLLVLNPDEVDLLAVGMATVESPVPYVSTTTTTYGPVALMVIAILERIGFNTLIELRLLTLFSTSLLMATLVSKILHLGSFSHCSSKLGIVRTNQNCPTNVVAPQLSLTLSIVVGVLTGSLNGVSSKNDFLHFSSEQIPMLLTTAALYFRYQFGGSQKVHPSISLSFAVALVSAASLAKYQFGFLGVWMVSDIAWTIVRNREQWLRSIALVVVTPISLILAISFLLPSLILGSARPLREFYFPPTAYSNQTSSQLIQRASEFVRQISEAPFAWISLLLIGIVIGIRWAIRGEICGYFRQSVAIHLSDKCVIREVWSLTPVGIGFMSCLLTPQPFPHYIYVVLVGAQISLYSLADQSARQRGTNEISNSPHGQSFDVLAKACAACPRRRRRAGYVVSFAAVTFGAALASPSISTYQKDLSNYLDANQGIRDKCASNGLVVLGWAPEVYLYTGIAPSTRFVVSSMLLEDTQYQDYYVREQINELNSGSCIMLAFGSPFFGYDQGDWLDSNLRSRLFESQRFREVSEVSLTMPSGVWPVVLLTE